MLFLMPITLAVAAIAQVPLQQSGMQNNATKIISTRQNQFFIPFEVAPALRKDVQEVELAYSTDHGENWYAYQKTSLEQKRFQFSAKNDGEYWFIFRLIHQNGEVKLAQATIPSVRVLVDTKSPEIQLNAKRGKVNEVIIDWQIEDTALAGNVPEIYLSYDLNVTWIRLAIDEKKVEKSENQISGQTVFYPPQGTKNIDIRCEMTDVAGNREIKTAKLDFTKMEDTRSGMGNELTGTTNHQPISVLPPRPSLKSNVSHPQNGQATQGILSDLNLGMETSTPQNAESLPRYASNMAAVQQDKSVQNPSELKIPLLDLNLTGNGLTPVTGEPPAELNIPEPVLGVPPTIQETSTPQADQTSTPKLEMQPTQEKTQETSAPEATVKEQEPLFPGKIALISMKQSALPVLIVRWHTGSEAEFKESRVDIYRSNTKQGPWTPVVFELPNTGEYLWNISEAEFSPFYLRVDLRSVKGLYTDFTSREINLMDIVKPK